MADCWLNPLQYVQEVAKCIVTEALWPIFKRHIDYWWCFDGNVQGMKDEIGYLERERLDMDRKIEEARLCAESATTVVENWSKEGTQKLEEATFFLQGCNDLKVWDIITRYKVGKSAKETAEGIAKLRNDGKSIRIADPAPPASMVSISHAPTLEFQSRKNIEEDIMKSLKDGNVRMIAICGAGGVGKTTMAKRIEDRVREEKLFDEVVKIVVSQQIDELKIQEQIAEILSYGLSERTLDGRAHKLRTRLMDSKKKLIIFDDVWERFELKDIGVPCANGLLGCRIILTSRLKDVCEEMEADEVIEIKVLDEEEAWTLFREKSGDCVDDLDLCPVAKDVAAECKGLPIALVTVGIALKNKKSLETWKDARSQLRGANPKNFPQVLKNVYMPLKLSYDFLETRSEKDLFLLCCLFPEDYNIRIEDLALLSFGLGMFEGINNIEDGRNRTHHLLERLKSRFLLMTGGHDDEVKMHDVVRDVAIFIGSKGNHGVSRIVEVSSMDWSSKDPSPNCNWMSVDISSANAKLPVGLDFQNLHLLMILNSTYYYNFSEGFDANAICFKGNEELLVLNFSIKELPPTVGLLKKLGTLHLRDCNVNDISVVGELASLEILLIWDCDDIEELPADVRKLKFLRLLELKYCEKLKRIVAGVISSLVRLEELKIVDCFNKWEAKGNPSEERNASLSELESLPNLTSLEIQILDANLFAEEIRLSQQLVRYQIHYIKRFGMPILDDMKHEREISLCLPRDGTVGNWIRQLVNRTQTLVLTGDGSMVKEFVNAIDCKFVALKCLFLLDPRELEMLIGREIPEGSNSFQNLESLTVQSPPMLGYSWKSLAYLKSIYIGIREPLRYLFPVAIARSLVQLQSLEIVNCDTIEQVFFIEMESNTCASIIEFPQLKILKLVNLPNLAAFTQGVEIIKSPQLTMLEIIGCPKLRTKIGLEFSNFNAPHHLVSSRCMIEMLRIWNCDIIEEIFWNETQDDGNRHIIFPELWLLELRDLPCLTTFWRGVESIRFPKLSSMTIGYLPGMNSFAAIDSKPTHDHHSLHFFCNQKVEIIGLKYLILTCLPDKISKIWCHHIPISFFHSLGVLYIFEVDGIRNSISSSIAKALVNLHTLYIRDCKGMVDVIEDETNVSVNSVFPNLANLEVSRNGKLRSFCQWGHAFDLPSLYQVEITDCPMMKTFTLGSLSTPKLSSLLINGVEIEMNDLNVGIHQFITREIANEDEYSEDEYNEDDQKHGHSADGKKEMEGEGKTESSKSNLT